MDLIPTPAVSLTPAPLPATGAAAGRPATDPKAVDDVARKFEETFLAQLLKEMRQTLEPDTLFPNDGGDVMGGMFDMFMSQALAGTNSLGIGPLVKQHLAAYEAAKQPGHLAPAVPRAG